MLKLCKLDDIPDGESRGFCVEGPNLSQRLLVVRRGKDIFGYVNVCPHNLSRLDPTPDKFLDDSKENIECSVHGALFDIETGECFEGPCFGDKLTPCPIMLKDDGVYLERDNVEIVEELSQWMSDLGPRE